MTALQLNFNFKKNIWAAPIEYKDLREAKEIAIDLETRDEGINSGRGAGWATKKGEIIGFAVATEGWEGYYPFGHFGGGNLIKEQVLNYMHDVCKLPCTKIFHNAQYDVGWLQAYGIDVKGPIVDTMIAGALIDENRYTYKLNALAKDYLGELKAETDLKEAAKAHGVDPKGEMWMLPAEHVGYYAEQDARLTYLLWQRFKHEIASQSLETIWDLESKLLPILIKMRMKGIRVDTEKASILQKDFSSKEKTILLKIKKLIGKDIDIWNARQIGFAFDKLDIEYPKTVKTQEPSFTQNWLSNNPHEISKLIVQAREVNKFHNTFLNSIMKFAHKGRIHAEINQLRSDSGGTVSGRLSIFLPEEGCKWGSFDYSQQEPRLVVHYAASIGEGYQGSQELVEAYANADADFHQTVADICGIERKQAKTIGLGLMYGMGKNKLANMLGLEFIEAKNMWQPRDFGIYNPETFENASAKYGSHNIKRAFTYKALNRLIQGSAADQTKQAVVSCHELGFTPLLQIHDELCFNIENQEQVDKIVREMEGCVELKVPSVVDIALGKDFGEAT